MTPPGTIVWVAEIESEAARLLATGQARTRAQAIDATVGEMCRPKRFTVGKQKRRRATNGGESETSQQPDVRYRPGDCR